MHSSSGSDSFREVSGDNLVSPKLAQRVIAFTIGCRSTVLFPLAVDKF
jgi:hypothetical protein